MSDTRRPRSNEHVVEVRYKPNARVMDSRGAWAEAIAEHMQLPHWVIVENRVDVFDDREALRVFVGYRNAGMTASDTGSRDFLPDKATKFLTFLSTLDGFGDAVHVERVGVRSKFCTPFEGTFEALKDRYATRFLRLSSEGAEAIGQEAKLIDIGGPLNFVDPLGNFNTMSGPMTEAQFRQFFAKDEGFPAVGLYFDIDYWQRPKEVIRGRDLSSLVRSLALASWDRHDRVANLLLTK